VSTITYTLIGLSIAAGMLAVFAALAIASSERRNLDEARARFKRVSDLLWETEAVERALEKQRVAESDVREITDALEEWRRESGGPKPESPESVENLDLEYPGDGFLRRVGTETRRAERGADVAEPRVRVTTDEARYIALRQTLLALLDDLSLESVLLDSASGERLDSILSRLPPAPSELHGSRLSN
jgi:hypothetical protein